MDGDRASGLGGDAPSVTLTVDPACAGLGTADAMCTFPTSIDSDTGDR